MKFHFTYSLFNIISSVNGDIAWQNIIKNLSGQGHIEPLPVAPFTNMV